MQLKIRRRASLSSLRTQTDAGARGRASHTCFTLLHESFSLCALTRYVLESQFVHTGFLGIMRRTYDKHHSHARYFHESSFFCALTRYVLEYYFFRNGFLGIMRRTYDKHHSHARYFHESFSLCALTRYVLES